MMLSLTRLLCGGRAEGIKANALSTSEPSIRFTYLHLLGFEQVSSANGVESD